MIFVLSGEGICLDDGEGVSLPAGHVPPTALRVTATASSTPAPEPLVLLGVVSQPAKIKKKPLRPQGFSYFCR